MSLLQKGRPTRVNRSLARTACLLPSRSPQAALASPLRYPPLCADELRLFVVGRPHLSDAKRTSGNAYGIRQSIDLASIERASTCSLLNEACYTTRDSLRNRLSAWLDGWLSGWQGIANSPCQSKDQPSSSSSFAVSSIPISGGVGGC